MNALGYSFLILLVALPIAWLVAEFKCGVSLRIALGVMAGILACLCVAGLIGVTTTFRYNIYYGENTKALIEASIRQLEAGNTNQVLKAFKQLQDSYQPTYENRANYNLLVSNAVINISQPTNSPH